VDFDLRREHLHVDNFYDRSTVFFFLEQDESHELCGQNVVLFIGNAVDKRVIYHCFI